MYDGRDILNFPDFGLILEQGEFQVKVKKMTFLIESKNIVYSGFSGELQSIQIIPNHNSFRYCLWNLHMSSSRLPLPNNKSWIPPKYCMHLLSVENGNFLSLSFLPSFPPERMSNIVKKLLFFHSQKTRNHLLRIFAI